MENRCKCDGNCRKPVNRTGVPWRRAPRERTGQLCSGLSLNGGDAFRSFEMWAVTVGYCWRNHTHQLAIPARAMLVCSEGGVGESCGCMWNECSVRTVGTWAPCALGTLPGYVSYCAGRHLASGRAQATVVRERETAHSSLKFEPYESCSIALHADFHFPAQLSLTSLLFC